MRVLVFSSLYPNNIWPSHGVFVKERMVHFARLTGGEIQVVAPVPYFPACKIGSYWHYSQVATQETVDGVAVSHPRYFMTPKVGMFLYGWQMFFSVLPHMRRVQQHYPFDLIDAHFLYPDGFAATLLGRTLKTPVVVSARGNDVLLYSRFATIRPLLRKTLRAAQQAITVSEELKAGLVRLGAPADKVTVIPNGVDAGKFHNIPQENARTTLGLSDKKTILSVGHLIHRKGFDRLLLVLKNLCTENRDLDLQLIIVGEGPLRKSLAETSIACGLGERVRFVGTVPHQDLALWYSAADVFCLLSRQEGCPNVVLESLACGTPVVATSVGEIPSLLASEHVGLLAEPNEYDMTRKILWALDKSWSRETIRAYAKGYTWERVAHSLAQVFALAVTPNAANASGYESVTEGGEQFRL